MRAEDLLLVNACDVTVGCANGGPERIGKNSLGTTGCWEERYSLSQDHGRDNCWGRAGEKRGLSAAGLICRAQEFQY